MATYEVPPELAVKCILSPAQAGLFNNLPPHFADFLTIVGDVLVGEGVYKYGLTNRDWGSLLRVSKPLYHRLELQSFWLREIGFLLMPVPANFSPLRLYHLLRKEQQVQFWERELLTSAVEEARDPKALTPLVVSLTCAESLAVWTKELTDLLKLGTYPTAPQAAQLGQLIDIVLKKGGNGLYIANAANAIAQEKRNRVLFAVLASEFMKRRFMVPIDDFSQLLPDVTCILHLVALVNGITVDELKNEKWVLTRQGLSHLARHAVLRCLSRLTWLGLADAFTKEGLFKAVAKNIHLGALINKSLAQTPDDAGLKQLRLFCACLRGKRYPKTVADFNASWKPDIVEPLRYLCEKNKLFNMNNKKWLSLDFDASLVDIPLPKPAKQTVEAVLAQRGNTRQSWTSLFDADVVSAPQVVMNVRTLILLNYPTQRVGKLLSTRLATLSTVKLLKLFQFIRATFTSDFVLDIVTKKELAIKAAHMSEGDEDAEVPVMMPPQIFKDNKNKTVEKAFERTVSVNFDQHSVDKYLKLIEGLLTLQSQRFVPKIPAASTRAVIVHTSELRNAMRSGLPPQIPTFTRTSLWRNEGVCLQQLALEGERFDTLKIGMTWCELPHPNNQPVDLDLSVLMFDDAWNFVTHCSFAQLHIAGADHSGDITTAPYPKGAREAVQINFPMLLKANPSVRYVAIMVYSYSGQSLDDLHDASVFVANPNKAGNGPGGMAVISAARLSGKGTCNCAGFVALESAEKEARKYFYCVDQTFQNLSREARSSATIVAKELKRITANVETEDPPYVRLSNLAAYYAALSADEVVIAHDAGEMVLQRPATLDRFSFYKRLLEEMAKVDETVKSKVPTVSSADPAHSHLIVFGGELVTPMQAHVANPSYASHGTLTVVNLRADVAKSERKNVGGHSSATVLTSTDILEHLGKVEDAPAPSLPLSE